MVIAQGRVTSKDIENVLIDITGMSDDEACEFVRCYEDDIRDHACEILSTDLYETIESYLKATS